MTNSDDDLITTLKKNMQTSLTHQLSTPEVVMAEFPVSSTELHKIANGDCCVLNARDSPFALRFLLKDSRKSTRSNFVINKYVIQIVARETKAYFRKENIAVRTKIVKTRGLRQTKIKPEKKKVTVTIKESEETLF